MKAIEIKYVRKEREIKTEPKRRKETNIKDTWKEGKK